MGIVSGIVVFVCIWWTVIFCTLPLWVKRDESGPEITGPGASEHPKIKEKFILTTLITSALWLVIYALISIEVISFREIAEVMSAQDID
jgi:predicted secreted protein